jgi:hypothetical protein
MSDAFLTFNTYSCFEVPLFTSTDAYYLAEGIVAAPDNAFTSMTAITNVEGYKPQNPVINLH